MMEHDGEPIRGLPGRLPPGEHVIWQGAPDWAMFARSVYRIRIVAGYFALLAAAGLLTGSVIGALVTLGVGVLGLGLLALLAWGSARTTVYTLTSRRMVLRVGVAIPKCFNLPLSLVGGADLRRHADGRGDIALTMIGAPSFGYALLWPHARPWKMREPQPMLRAIPDAEIVAARLTRACAAVVAIDRPAPVSVAPPASPQPVGAAA
jgi:hypothetical protein